MTLAEPVGMDGIGSSVGADACGCDSGFVTAISMAEAAADRNPAWWNEIRTSADDALDAAYLSSKLLGALIQSAAHRLGVPAADIWGHIRRTGELPL
ncbi:MULTISPECIES: hypothetical protein [Gordonia]|uniref:hypothetical protein n=1 Tax=Gordonia TaxID=2053 RepID=UPI0004109CC6|nr:MULTISPECIES: hypothetical protein [Gordonia]KAF0970689.1 hypothetical protein BPODLACK_00962 [Gordonia sp. YY1]